MKVITKSIRLPAEVWEAISEYRHANRIKSEAEAIRLVVKTGLERVGNDRG
jgi:hypothetical protein